MIPSPCLASAPWHRLLRGVWRYHKIQHLPEYRRLIGTKWVFRIKNDLRRIFITMLLDNEWEADIVEIETDILYGDLEEEI